MSTASSQQVGDAQALLLDQAVTVRASRLSAAKRQALIERFLLFHLVHSNHEGYIHVYTNIILFLKHFCVTKRICVMDTLTLAQNACFGMVTMPSVF